MAPAKKPSLFPFLRPRRWPHNMVFSLDEKPMNQPQNQELAQAGLAALQRGDRAAAREAFGRLIQTGQADATAFLLFAQCCDDEADVNGSGGEPDISDITSLIDHLYISHKALPDCP